MSAKKLLLLFVMLFIISASNARTLKIKKKDLKKLSSMLAGEFSNEAQAKEDRNFQHAILRICPLWKDEINGHWFYAEQSDAASESSPTLQMIYHIYQLNDTTVECKSYDLKNAAQYTGAWNDAGKLGQLTLDSLRERSGCSVMLYKRKNNVYSGNMMWGTCAATQNGAAYASTEMVIYKKKLVRWDRQWNDKDKQVGGNVKGAYHFIKKKKLK
ncbi:MAG: chromophore lyase CpcT/CpeT [Chitinophagaceae bacterium]|nr:chromophore lyase CpcT/CpeT [Chitinophagaceae bacterium]